MSKFRGSSQYAAKVERSLPKLTSRGEGKSPLKYIMNILLLDFEYFIEKKFHFLTRVSILGVSKLLLRGQTLGAKSAQKCCHVGTLEAVYLSSLVTNMKAEQSTSCSLPIKLLDFLHLSINRVV